MSITIALTGNPNSGKTTMFNDLTGSNQYVGNWPGVTVEKKMGYFKDEKEIQIQDLPGIYSLSPYTSEEVVSRNFLLDECPDVILNIVDASNIERNLYLTTQLLELGIPVVIALNMIDVIRKRGDTINIQELERVFGCPVFETSALLKEGSREAVAKAVELAKMQKEQKHLPSIFEGTVEHSIAHIEEIIEKLVPADKVRWYAIKLFERDADIQEKLKLDAEQLAHIEEHIANCEKDLDDDSESIIINQRYLFITKQIERLVIKKNIGEVTLSEKIDSIVTNRFYAIPIFAAVIFLVYYISVTTLGTLATDYTNDIIIGEFVQGNLNEWLERSGTSGWLAGLVVDGIVGGVGAVLGFIPQILMVSFLLAILEDIGYMARIAFIMDKIFRKFGLSGKSFIPMLIGSGCGIPGVMASRTVETESDRRMTILTTTFIPCSAKLPIIALIAGALFGGEWWVAPSAYFMGIFAIVISGIMLKKTKLFASTPSPFVMELPPYHLPVLGNILRVTLERGVSFFKKATTIILLSSIVLWFLQGYGFENGSFAAVENSDESLLAVLGNIIAPLFAPVGFGTWQATVGTVTGLIAKENVVSTLGVLYGFAEVAESGEEFWTLFANDFTKVSAYAFLVFNLLCAPCFAAIGAIKREMNNPAWTWFAITFQCALAYVVSLIIYQLGTFMTTCVFTFGTFAGFGAVVFIVYMLIRRNPYNKY